jgi:chemotaxis signal transduction protein
MAESDSLRYLPLEIGNQIFGIRMNDVIAVRRLAAPDHTTQVEAAPAAETAANAEGASSDLPVIDLRHLLWKEKTTGKNKPVIIVSSGNKAAALLVDSAMPIRSADEENSQPYPKLARFENCFFDRVVREQEGLVLLFDVPLLLNKLGAASPTLIAEGEYGS